MSSKHIMIRIVLFINAQIYNSLAESELIWVLGNLPNQMGP